MNDMSLISFTAEGPQPLLRDIRAPAPFPVSALGPLQAAVKAVQGDTLAPVAIPAASALGIAALAVQAFADVETLGGPRPTSLYLMTVAQSGERKSSCDSLLMSGLRDYERGQVEANRDLTAAWLKRHTVWQMKLDQVKGKIKAGKGGTDELDELGSEPAAPAQPDRTVSDPTVQGLARKFVEGQPSLGIFSDEAGQFLGGYAMKSENKQHTLAALNDAWQGSPIRRTLSGEGSTVLYGRRLSAHLMIQPIVARIFMGDRLAGDTGFLPRFLISEPSSTIGTRFSSDLRPDPKTLSAFAVRLTEILNTPMPADPDIRELSPRLLRLSLAARKLLVAFSDAIEREQAPGGELSGVTAYASKAAEQAARIAGVLTLWSNLNAPSVSDEAMVWGIELAQYYLSEAARLSDAAMVSDEIDRAERLRKWLVYTWSEDTIVVRDVLRGAPVRELRESPKARAAIAILEKYGWLMRLETGTIVRGAARKEAWRIVRSFDVV